jgi:hypothetical protein
MFDQVNLRTEFSSVPGQMCFPNSEIGNVKFEPNLRLTRVEDSAFHQFEFEWICIPHSLQVIRTSWFVTCSIQTLTFEALPQPNRIEDSCFWIFAEIDSSSRDKRPSASRGSRTSRSTNWYSKMVPAWRTLKTRVSCDVQSSQFAFQARCNRSAKPASRTRNSMSLPSNGRRNWLKLATLASINAP